METGGLYLADTDRKDGSAITKTRVAILVTVLYLGFIVYLRGCEAWLVLGYGELNELGDFLAGVLTPVALFWLIVGYFLQRDEFGLQRQELKETRETLSTQVKVLKEQADAERKRSMPNLSLELTGLIKLNPVFTLRNIGGPARNLKAKVEGTTHLFTRPSLDTVEECEPPILRPSRNSLHYTACFTSELHQRFYQRWRILFAALPRVEEITNGPALLEDGQSPPAEESE